MPKQSGFLKGSSVYFLGSALGQVFPLLLLPVLTRVLSPADYGIVTLFAATEMLCRTFVGLGGHVAVTRAYYEVGRGGTGRYVGSLILLLPVTLTAVVVPMAIWYGELSDFMGLPGIWLALVPLTSITLFLSETNLALWQAEQRPSPYVAFNLLRAATYFSSAIVLVVFLRMSWQGMLISLVGSSALFSVASVAIMIRRGYLTFEWGRKELLFIVRFSGPLVPHKLARFGQNWSDRFFITHFIGIDAAGIYAVSSSLSRVMDLVVDSYGKAWAPHVFSTLRNATPDQRVAVVRQTYLYLASLAVLTALLAFLIPFLTPLLLGPNFREAGSIVPILLAAGFVDGAFRSFSVYIQNATRTGLTAVASVSGTLVQLASLYPMIAWQGVHGAGLALLLGSAVSLLISIWACQRVHPMPWLVALRTRMPKG